MMPERRQKLEAAGFVESTPEDFFGLDDTDRKVVQMRLAAAREVRRLREEQGLTQKQLAERLKVAQSRITGIEKGDGASLDAILTAYIELGGQPFDFGGWRPSDERRKAPGPRPQRRPRRAPTPKLPAGYARTKGRHHAGV